MLEGTGGITYDSSSKNQNAELKNGTNWTAMNSGAGVYLDGTNQYLLMPSTVITGTKMTILFKADIPPQNAGLYILQQRDIMNIDNQFVIKYGAVSSSRGITFWDYNGGYGFAANNSIMVDFPRPADICVVRDGIKASLYINGLYVANFADAAKVVEYKNRRFAVGCDYRDLNAFIKMSMEYLSVYNRALSSNEIAWLYSEPYCMLEYPTRTHISIPV